MQKNSLFCGDCFENLQTLPNQSVDLILSDPPFGITSLECDAPINLTDMGSGSTGVACKTLNRNFVGIEKNKEYFEVARERISG